MKKIIIPVSMLFLAGLSHAQTTTPSTTENYVYTKTYLSDPTLPNVKVAETVQYIDGLGRPKQVVNVKASPLGKDVVSYIEYDGFGRQTKDYLPVPQSGTLNGAIVPTPLGDATSVYGNEKIYAEKILENSPLDRIQQQIQVGTDWSTKPVKFDYEANIAGEVKKFVTTTTIVNGATSSVLSPATDSNSENGNYKASQLYKNTVTDEDGNKTIEFKNGQGQTILVRKVLSATENADTYYVYNEYNQLAFVIPPLASVSTSIDAAILDNLCYQYRYDGRNRLLEKKLPGKGWEYMVYNKADQLVMTQDANLAAQGKWLFTKYDEFGRVVFTGITNNTATRQTLQTAVTAATYTNEKRSLNSFTISGMPIYYTNRALPGSLAQVLSINYYDTYPAYSFNPAFPSTILGNTVITDNPANNGGISTKSLSVMSLVKNIEDDNWTKNYSYYDVKGRPIGSYSINHLGGYTKTESQVDFAGVTKQTKTYHKRLSTDTEKVITENFEYDNQNRLLTHTHQVDNNFVEVLAQNTYNELSQLSNKQVGGFPAFGGGNTFIQSIDYAYNIRGWMTKVNDPANLNGKLFGYEIKYTNPETSNIPGRFNGNIAEIDWKTATTPNDNKRRYDYKYDPLNRLLEGAYSDVNATIINNNYFTEKLTYDLNGNIATLQRFDMPPSGTTANKIDDLIYNYENNGASNRLTQVTLPSGVANNTSGYNALGSIFQYDLNGNMTSHLDKLISEISYNFLNLPFEVKIKPGTKTGVTTQYNYRADGVKIEKNYRITSTQSTTITTYLDGFQYSSYTGPLTPAIPPGLQFVPTAEGYYDFQQNKYIYNYVDHLGNVRLSYTKSASGTEIIEENNYYPFGLKHEGYNVLAGNPAYKYKYNGKELQETGMYDYGARFYMPDLGRWGVVDPQAETSRRWSPYTYAYNNPIRFIDPDGRENKDIHILGNFAEEGLKQLQSSVDGQLTLSMDKAGKVTATAVEGATLSEAADKLLSASTNKCIDAKIQTDYDMRIDEDNSRYLGGASRGSKTDPVTGITTATNVVNPQMLGNLDNAYYGSATGYGMLHETLETIVMAENFPNAPAATSEENNSKGYNYSHKEANRLDTRNIDPNPNWTSIKSSNYSINNGKYTEFSDSYKIQNVNTKVVKEIGSYKTLKRNK